MDTLFTHLKIAMFVISWAALLLTIAFGSRALFVRKRWPGLETPLVQAAVRYGLLWILLWLLIALGPGCSPSGAPHGGTPSGVTLSMTDIMWVFRRENGVEADNQTTDIDYFLPTPAWMEKAVQKHQKGLWPGAAEDDGTRDCDDYARRFWDVSVSLAREEGDDLSPAVGMLFTQTDPLGQGLKHALNFFVAPDRAIWFLEPQSGRMWRPSTEELRTIYFWLL